MPQFRISANGMRSGKKYPLKENNAVGIRRDLTGSLPTKTLMRSRGLQRHSDVGKPRRSPITYRAYWRWKKALFLHFKLANKSALQEDDHDCPECDVIR